MKRTLFEPEHADYRESVGGSSPRRSPRITRPGSEDGIVPRDLFAKAAAKGMLAMQVPERFGGTGTDDFRFNQIVVEEVSVAGVAGSGLGITLHNDICLPYFTHFCNDEQAERWLPGIADGSLITAVAMTEPEMGSDLAGLRTTAIRDDDEYVVNGSKTFITNGINADLVIAAVKTDPSQRHGGISLLIIERGMEGFERGRNLEKLGMHAQDTAELFFEDVRVPAENLLGEEGQGFRYMTSNLPQERLSIAIAGVAAARGALDATSRTSRSARAFGQPIGTFQNTRFALAEMATEVAARDHVLRPGGAGAQRRRAVGRGRGDGEVVVDRAPGPRGRPLSAAARRLRLHARVPDRAGVRRRARDPHLRRHDRDHEGDHRPLARPIDSF